MTDQRATPARAPLSVATDLTIEVNGAEADVESTGERLFVEFRSIADAIRAARGRPRGTGTDLSEVLTLTDLTLEFRVRGRTVAVAGAGARPGAVSRSLGTDPFEIRLGGILGAAGRELSAGIDAVSDLVD
ncbi:MAG: hypothetical protein ACOC0F_00205 [archaeon]